MIRQHAARGFRVLSRSHAVVGVFFFMLWCAALASPAASCSYLGSVDRAAGAAFNESMPEIVVGVLDFKGDINALQSQWNATFAE
eukprot:scaffold53858_cov52-Prasinocladus_malaysianus.AAC.1